MTRKLIVRLICTGIGALALSTAAFGQDREGTMEPRVRDEAADKAPIGISGVDKDALASGYRASKLVKAAVWNDKGERIGRVDDVILAADGKLAVAVVDVGGFLGMGSRQVAVPIDQLSQVTPKTVLPGATKETLKAMPSFEWKK